MSGQSNPGDRSRGVYADADIMPEDVQSQSDYDAYTQRRRRELQEEQARRQEQPSADDVSLEDWLNTAPGENTPPLTPDISAGNVPDQQDVVMRSDRPEKDKE